jgi:AcrR family transcriptional regulator
MSKRDEILSAAQKLFGRYGLKRVTTDDIARVARVSKATIYKLYRNKQEILHDVVDHELTVLQTEIKTAVAAEIGAEAKLRAHLLTRIAAIHNLINLHNVTRESLDEQWDQAQALRERFLAEETELIGGILREGVQQGDFEIVNIKATAHFMALALASLECPWNIDGLDLTVDDQVDLMMTVLLSGLKRRT